MDVRSRSSADVTRSNVAGQNRRRQWSDSSSPGRRVVVSPYVVAEKVGSCLSYGRGTCPPGSLTLRYCPLMTDHVDELVAWTLRMSRSDREAEPIHVTQTSVWLAAIGFLALSLGQSLLCWAPTGGRLEFILLTAGTLCIAAAILTHLDTHRLRFGLPALVFFNLGILAASAVWIPYVIDPADFGTGKFQLYVYILWGMAWTLGAIGTFFVLHRKEARLERGDRKAATTIHASFFQLLSLGVGMLIYGISFIEQSTLPNNNVSGVLAVVGPVLIAISVISHVEHLTLRIGRPAVILTILGISIWSVKNLSRAATDWMSDPALYKFFIFGIQGIVYAMGAVACILVLSRKKAWLASRSESARLSSK